ncbi:MAG: glutamate--tRNA ligase [Chitinivibrionales bacterium]|nr:glutamate--tRNA ligase [Chitinivibrionales bacterium]
MPAEIRVRFAPSPTGYLHVGGARTALFNYLFARRSGGTFILRIEDTDRGRFQESALEEIYQSLRWLGLDWDEGPQKGGEVGPYIQSERLDRYQKYADQLIQSEHAYRCFCTPQRLEEVRLKREKEKQSTGYDRLCRDLTPAQIEENLAQNKPYIVRLKIPAGRTVSFNDLIRGKIDYQSDILDDLVLLKTDGFPTYHLANVVDDHAMRISHVLRGDEWIASTPRHVLLYEAFGWTPPLFAHMPVILDPSGGKLSKRKGAASVMDYKRTGILPEALFNFIAFLGWSPGDEREKMGREEMIEAFSLENISPKASVFDEKKLEWMNGLYLHDHSAESLVRDVFPLLKAKGFISSEANEHDPIVVSAISLLKDRSRRLTEIVENASYFFIDPVSYEEKAVIKYFAKGTKAVFETLIDKLDGMIEFNQVSLDKLYHEYSTASGVAIGELIHPTRLAVSGVSFGPGLFELMQALGKETVFRRIKTAISWLEKNSATLQ